MDKSKVLEKLKENELIFEVVDFAQRQGGTLDFAAELEKYYFDGADAVLTLPEGKNWSKDGHSCADVYVAWYPDYKSKKGIDFLAKELKENWIDEDCEEFLGEERTKKIKEEMSKLDFSQEKVKKAISLTRNNDWQEVKKGLLSKENTLFSPELKKLLKDLEGHLHENFLWAVCPLKESYSSWAFCVETLDCLTSSIKERIERMEKREVSREEVEAEINKNYFKTEDMYVSIYDPTCMVSLKDKDLRDGFSDDLLGQILSQWFSLILGKSITCKKSDKVESL